MLRPAQHASVTSCQSYLLTSPQICPFPPTPSNFPSLEPIFCQPSPWPSCAFPIPILAHFPHCSLFETQIKSHHPPPIPQVYVPSLFLQHVQNSLLRVERPYVVCSSPPSPASSHPCCPYSALQTHGLFQSLRLPAATCHRALAHAALFDFAILSSQLKSHFLRGCFSHFPDWDKSSWRHVPFCLIHLLTTCTFYTYVLTV